MLNKKKVIYHDDFKTVSALLKYVKGLPEGGDNYNAVHAMTVKGMQISWDYTFPSISGECNVCKHPVSGYSIEANICKNSGCSNGNLSLKSLENKWFWARFNCVDKNGDNAEHTCMATNEFTEKALKTCTHGQIVNVKTLEYKMSRNISMNKIYKDLIPSIMDATILIKRRKIKTLQNNIIKEIDLPRTSF